MLGEHHHLISLYLSYRFHVQCLNNAFVSQTPGQSFMPMDDIEERLVQEYQELKKDIQMHETDMKENLFARKKWRRGMDIEALFKNQLSDLKRKECSIVVVGKRTVLFNIFYSTCT